jgi:tRNA modification GTPase
LPKLEHLFAAAGEQFGGLLRATRNGARLTRGMHAVITGAPNVGKSSLLNALAGSERAIVTDIPGTTRDVLRESVMFDGLELTLADTAGLRESKDVVEGEGIRRARAELARAELLLVVAERGEEQALESLLEGIPESVARIVVINKIDVDGVAPSRAETGGVVTIALSARTGAGLDLLRDELKRIAAGEEVEGAFSARSRHILALERAGEHLDAARSALATATPELIAEDLRGVQQALGEITGVFSSEDLLGAIFSTFCIGK